MKGSLYENFLRPVLFLFEPERVHDFFIAFGEFLGKLALVRFIFQRFFYFEDPSLKVKVRGLDFKNPLGLAAGFDKDARLTKLLPTLGFGFMEVGSVTRHPYAGNPGRRLLRLPEDKSLIVYYGLKSRGAEVLRNKIKKLNLTWPVGLNIAKTNRADIVGEKSVEDYVATYKMLAPYFSYVTINVSCPNVQDGCFFQEPHLLDQLLMALGREEKKSPIFLKISCDLSFEKIDEILAVVKKYSFVDGFVVANLSKRRDILKLNSSVERLDLLPQGGISGAPVKELSTKLISYIYKKTGGAYTIIGLGGIFTAEDAYEKFLAGASLVQIATGLIYGGPFVVKKIKRGLVELLACDGYKNISEAVGQKTY